MLTGSSPSGPRSMIQSALRITSRLCSMMMTELLDVLHRLTDLGNSVIIIEHNLDVIRNADWIIDLGPEGGEEGGRIVAQGTPEQVARNKKSYTGQALASYFSTNGRSAEQPKVFTA